MIISDEKLRFRTSIWFIASLSSLAMHSVRAENISSADGLGETDKAARPVRESDCRRLGDVLPHRNEIKSSLRTCLRLVFAHLRTSLFLF